MTDMGMDGMGWMMWGAGVVWPLVTCARAEAEPCAPATKLKRPHRAG